MSESGLRTVKVVVKEVVFGLAENFLNLRGGVVNFWWYTSAKPTRSPRTRTLLPRQRRRKTPDVISFYDLPAPRGGDWGWLGLAGMLYDNHATYEHLEAQRSLVVYHRSILFNLMQFGSLVVV